jgi:hypothetical protein
MIFIKCIVEQCPRRALISEEDVDDICSFAGYRPGGGHLFGITDQGWLISIVVHEVVSFCPYHAAELKKFLGAEYYQDVAPGDA